MSSLSTFDLYAPAEEHTMLRETVRAFTKAEVEPQALEYDREEKFNLALFRKLGELGLLGITAPEDFGGSGMDATAAVIVHEELSASDPGFCLAYLAHAMLCVNNFAVTANAEQSPSTCKAIGLLVISGSRMTFWVSASAIICVLHRTCSRHRGLRSACLRRLPRERAQLVRLVRRR